MNYFDHPKVDELIDLAASKGLMLDIYAIAGWIKVGEKTFHTVDDALAYVKAHGRL